MKGSPCSEVSEPLSGQANAALGALPAAPLPAARPSLEASRGPRGPQSPRPAPSREEPEPQAASAGFVRR